MGDTVIVQLNKEYKYKLGEYRGNSENKKLQCTNRNKHVKIKYIVREMAIFMFTVITAPLFQELLRRRIMFMISDYYRIKSVFSCLCVKSKLVELRGHKVVLLMSDM